MKYKLNLTALAVMLAVGAFAVSGQTDPRSAGDLQQRLADLENKVRSLSEELAQLRAAAAKQGEQPQVVAKTAAPTDKAAVEVKPAAAAPKKDLGVDVGSARLTPYGTIYFNAFGNTGGVNNTDVPMWATASPAGNMSASVRQTRLGLRLEGAKVGSARLGAVVEADFFGGFPAMGIGENFGVVRLRLANVKLDWEKTAITLGQDWMPFAPLNPTSLAAAAIPQMAAAGNVWARIPQARVERKIGANVSVTGAVLAPQTGDSSVAFLMQPNSGASSRIPFFQGRVAFSGRNWFASKKPGAVGVSAHGGRASVFVGTPSTRVDTTSWGAALDWNLPFSDVVALTGEAFVGQGLGGFQGAIFQMLNTNWVPVQGMTSTPPGVRAIKSRGGWAQLAVTPRMKGNKLGLYATLGLDDPDDATLTSVNALDWRKRNLAIAGELIYKFTPQFQMGVEVRRFETFSSLNRKRTAEHLNLAFAYSF